MKTISAFGAALALSAAAAIPSGVAHAATINITGSSYSPGYGTSIDKNNVVGFGPSGLSDPTNGAAWKAGGSVTSNVAYYAVDWYFNGAESGNTNLFFASMALTYTESNENNNFNPGNDPGWKFLGTTTGSGLNTPIKFSVSDLNPAGTVQNGANNAQGLMASLLFSYVKPTFNSKGEITGWKLTKIPTDWVVFGFDDPGSKDNDYDDYVGVAHVRETLRPTPLPGALPLMGSVLGAGYFWRRWRGNRAPAAA
jgi:hypothetical protein